MVFARRLVDLMLFRCGPQHLPGDQATLIRSAGIYCILLFTQVALVGPIASAVVQAVLATVLLGLYAAIILRVRGLANRFNQTATALFSSGAVLTLLMLLPARALRPYLQAMRSASDPSNVSPPASLLLLVLLGAVIGVWGLAIYSHIYRHALQTSIGYGIAATFGFELLMLAVSSLGG